MRYNQRENGFTLIELLIVTGMIGILAAIVVPILHDHLQQAREAAAKDNLRILRNAIGIYTTQHNDVPPGNSIAKQLTKATNKLGQYAEPGTDGYDFGPYLKKMPKNPFSGKSDVYVIDLANPPGPNELFQDEFGWLYGPDARYICLDKSGTDSKGNGFYNY